VAVPMTPPAAAVPVREVVEEPQGHLAEMWRRCSGDIREI